MNVCNYFKQNGGFSLIKNYIYNHVLLYAFLIFVLLPKNKKGLELLRECINIKIYNRLKRKYLRRTKKNISNNQVELNSNYDKSKIIWFCWFQGIQNAPDLVKASLKSIKKNCNGYLIQVIDKENYTNFTRIPLYIIEKWEKGIITDAHFSDILRTNLLVLHGGTWIDATVYLSGKIPNDIVESDLFFFRTFKPGSDGHCISLSSWFISTKKNNRLLEITQTLLFEYWKKNNYLCHYFLFHIFLSFGVELFPDLVSAIPKYSNENPHFLLFELGKDFSNEKWISISKKSFCHKLTNKLSSKDKEKKNSFYKYIIGGRLE